MWDNTFSEQEKVKLKLHQKANWAGVIEKYWEKEQDLMGSKGKICELRHGKLIIVPFDLFSGGNKKSEKSDQIH